MGTITNIILRLFNSGHLIYAMLIMFMSCICDVLIFPGVLHMKISPTEFTR